MYNIKSVGCIRVMQTDVNYVVVVALHTESMTSVGKVMSSFGSMRSPVFTR